MSWFWEKLLRPAMFSLDAERAHEIGLRALESGLASPFYVEPRPIEVDRFGLKFANPLGVAAGFDKNGVVVDQLERLGFGFVEVGTVTFHPQPGNPRPRLFRLPQDQALINRLGFNNDGAEAVAERLQKLKRRCIVGVNIGRNKDVPNEEAIENYLSCFDLVHPVADYIAVNISSPNTPGLRELQRGDQLEDLLGALQEQAQTVEKPLLVKIAPDLADGDTESIVDACVRHGIKGVIATNTTVSRDGLRTTDVARFGEGGLSGRPIADRSNAVISTIYRHSKGKLPVIGVGGVFTPEDAFAKVAAGASLVQAYTGFVYGGPAFARDIVTGLGKILQDRGFRMLDEAVGSELTRQTQKL
jgi:dihydroorotate dehydrogenase